MATDLALQILLTATDAASPILQNFSNVFNQKLQSLGPGLSMAAGFATAFAGAIIGIGAASVNMAAQYQQQMNMVQALTGSNAQQMSYYDAQVKQLAMDAGVAPAQLAQGLYQIISSGAQGKQAMQELTLATEDSKIGMTSAATTADALTNVLANFSWQTKDATLVNGEMLETVTLGKSTFQQYASTITKAASTSAQFKISLETTSAAWATLTANGISAGKASTDYVQVVQSMYGKIDTVTKSLHKNGIAFDEAKFNAMSFGDKVQYLNTALQKAAEKHVTVTGVTLQAAQAVTVISGHMDAYNKNLATLSDKSAMAQKTQQAWSTTQGGFTQSMSRLNATLQVVMINIGQALLPVLTRLVNWVANGISAFTNWATHSQVLQSILHSLGTAFQTLGSWVGKVADFFAHNAAAMTALKVVGIAVAGAVLGLLVAGFVALAIAAGTAAIATLTAIGPFLLIGAGIALLIAVIALLVTHWSQMTSWIGGQMSRFGGFIHGIITSIGNWFSNLGTSVHNFFSGIGTAFGNFFSALGSIVRMGLMLIVNYFLLPFHIIGALFSWLYEHNYYFQHLVDTIRKIIAAGLAWLQHAWQTAIGWLVGLWRGLSGLATTAWTNLVKAIQTAWSMAVGIVTGIWQKISSIFSGAWNTYVSKPLSTLWTNVANTFSGAWGAVSKGLSSLWNNITSTVGGWAKSAVQWGQNLIQGFLNGIGNMIGNIGKTLGNVGNSIKNFLGFHSPTKEGPGREADQWAPNLVKMFAGGLAAGQPKIQTALNAMVSPLAKVMHSTTSTVSPIRAPAAASSGHTFNFTTTVNGLIGSNKKEVVDYLDQQLSRRMRRQTNLVTQSSGGRSS